MGTSEVDDRILEVLPAVRRLVATRVADPERADDIVQEVAARVLAARDRLRLDTLQAYAVATARNLMRSEARRVDIGARHAHRLHDPSAPPHPEDEAVRREEAAAMRAALRRLPDTDRDALLAHEVRGLDVASIAKAHGSTPGGAAVRLFRARANLRVEYVLALDGGTLPTPRCRPVLVALSSGDRRRQEALDAARHLIRCQTCGRLATPVLERKVVERKVGPLVLAPLLLAAAALRWLVRSARAHPVQAAVATAGLGAAAVVGVNVLAAGPGPSAPPAAPPPAVQIAGPDTVRAETAVVDAVVADEGFWVRTSGGERAWVQVFTNGAESPQRIDEGVEVSFTARVVPHGAGYAGLVGVDASEGAEELDGKGWHFEVGAEQLRVG